MKILANVYPHGKKSALTMSYDDGLRFDRRLVEIFNRNGIKGTFHLNGGRSESDGIVTHEEYASLYAGHEVSCHLLTHPFPRNCPDSVLVGEIIEDRRILEKYCGYTVRGMSYPYGEYSEKAIEIFRTCGMKYARTVASTNDFILPEDFMRWNPTTHHNGNLTELFDRMLSIKYTRLQCMYVWGHSYEFDRQNNWEVIEEFCKHASGNDDVWYATNIEIYDYVTALRNLEVSIDGRHIYNGSANPVWVTADGECVEIKPGHNTL